jgi:hypothetical protein
VITGALDIIPHIDIHGNATLTVLSKGRLIINCETTYNSGIYLVGKLVSKGEVDIFNTAFMKIDVQGGEMLLENQPLAGN